LFGVNDIHVRDTPRVVRKRNI